MKPIVALLLLGAIQSLCAETLFLDKTTDSSPSFVWTISSEPPLQLPKWEKGKNPPLSLADAEKLAFEWTRKQPLAGEIPERPFQIVLARLPAPYNKDYYYKLNYGSETGKTTFWTVFILMDKTIIEPRKIEKAEPAG